jgi:hypothetical protein
VRKDTLKNPKFTLKSRNKLKRLNAIPAWKEAMVSLKVFVHIA